MKPISLHTFPDKDFHPDAEKNLGVSENMEELATHDEEDLSSYFTHH